VDFWGGVLEAFAAILEPVRSILYGGHNNFLLGVFLFYQGESRIKIDWTTTSRTFERFLYGGNAPAHTREEEQLHRM
jgi:hypothetical protein